MGDDERHFPDTYEYVWAIDCSHDGSRWWPWNHGFPEGGFAAGTDDVQAVLTDALALWFTAAALAALDFDDHDTWVRASVWRLGRIVHGGLVTTAPAEAASPAAYGRWLHASGIAPDAVAVRTPYEAVRLVDAAALELPSTSNAS